MFTNWLTDTTSSSNRITNTSNNIVLEANESQHESPGVRSNSMLLSTPPDVMLEVGPAPATCVRFVAHSLVLGMHSGYLRSAIRLDEHAAAAGTRTNNGIRNSGTSIASNTNSSSTDIVLYLSNVTAEQFAPLLTYMYTGYLDLNVENIFAILLATHVLHMPRALEICRTFLARAQTEGYLTNNNVLNNLTATAATATTTSTVAAIESGIPGDQAQGVVGNNKIIRPIPSKATMVNFGFLPLPAAPRPLPPTLSTQPLATVTTTAYKCLQQAYQQQQQQFPQILVITEQKLQQTPAAADENDCEAYEDIDVVQPDDSSNERRQSLLPTTSATTKYEMLAVENDGDGVDDVANDDHEDVEVLIDSNTETEDNEVTDIDKEYTKVLMQSASLTATGTVDVNEDATNHQTRAQSNVMLQQPLHKHQQKQQQQQYVIADTQKYRHKNNSAIKLLKNEKSTRGRLRATTKMGNSSSNKRTMHRVERSNNNAAGSGLQVAKAPIPASQLETVSGVEQTKVIIDVASCDGPVRFRRILNAAYGNKPADAHAGFAAGSISGGGVSVDLQRNKQRTQQSLSYSFHQQMAKTINQQRLLHHANETENNGEANADGSGNRNYYQSQPKFQQQQQQNQATLSGECGSKGQQKKSHGQDAYICVYCKHTFKSQYCYQKHAKRHLNPLNLNASSSAAAATVAETPMDELLVSVGSNLKTNNSLHNRKQHAEFASPHRAASNNSSCSSGSDGKDDSYHNHQQQHQVLTLESTTPMPAAATVTAGANVIRAAANILAKQSTNDQLLLRREVRPLDMNVQYYPCKTCGSKFPSYYFVHKHRKLCHADEEQTTTLSAVATNNSATTTTTTTTATNPANPLIAASDEAIETLTKIEDNTATCIDANNTNSTSAATTTTRTTIARELEKVTEQSAIVEADSNAIKY